MGLVTAAGVGVDPAWDRIEEGSSCIRPVNTFDARAFPAALGAELHDLPRVGRDDDERSIHLLLAAADTFTSGLGAYLRRRSNDARRTAVVLGTSKGVILAMAQLHRRFARGIETLSSAEVEAIHRNRPGYGALRLAEHIGARGPRSSLGLACASSSMAFLQAAELIRSGVVDRAVAGGFDGFSPFIFTGFHVIGALSQQGCRPFDQRRDGTVLGEGAALLVLESEEAAAERGAHPLALYEGGGFAGDGVHLTAPDRRGRGLQRAVRQALDQAGLTPGDLDYVNAHGTGTVFNDAMECEAFRAIFAEQDRVPPLSSIKSVFGHTLGAAGALDVIVSIEALRRQMLPPTVNGAEEPLVPQWDFVTEGVRPTSGLDVVLTTNSGFAGNNTALVFRRYGSEAELSRPPTDELGPPPERRCPGEPGPARRDGAAP